MTYEKNDDRGSTIGIIFEPMCEDQYAWKQLPELMSLLRDIESIVRVKMV